MLVNKGLLISLMQIVKYIITVNLSCLGCYCSKNFIWLSNLSILSVLHNDYSRNALYAIHLISTFSLLSLGPRRYHRPVISASALTWFVIIFINQAQASKQFLASIKLASNKAICLKTKKINKSNMYF